MYTLTYLHPALQLNPDPVFTPFSMFTGPLLRLSWRKRKSYPVMRYLLHVLKKAFFSLIPFQCFVPAIHSIDAGKSKLTHAQIRAWPCDRLAAPRDLEREQAVEND